MTKEEATTRQVTVAIYEPYPMGLGGGNFRTQYYILKFLDRSRLLPIVVSPEDMGVIATFRGMGVECVTLTPPASIHRFAGQVLKDSVWGRLRSALDLVGYNIRLARFFRKRRVDVLYCNSIRSLLLSGLGAKLAGVPILWYIKGQLDNPVLDRIGFWFSKRILFFCEANRDDFYPELVKKYRSKIHILPIGLDPDEIAEIEASDRRELARELDIRPDRMNAIVLGQVFPPKGQHHIVNGLKDIVRAHPNFMLYIVGDHVLEAYRPYRAELELIIARDGLQDHVRFTGWRTDAMKILSLMDLVVHPSLAEGFGRAVLEAMALGKAVVVSAVGGLREIIRDGENGFLVPPGDTPALVDRTLKLIEDPALRASLGAAAKRAVMERFLIEDKVRQLQQHWLKMAGRASEEPVCAALRAN